MVPSIIYGGNHTDDRGKIIYNNSFDSSAIRRIYVIENTINFIRRWQGHKIEQRWFSAVKGSFTIQLIQVDDWSHPNKALEKLTFELSDKTLDILHLPAGYISSIESISEGARLLAMSNYSLNEIKDEYKFSIDYFEK
jgi:hypothetical protein